MKKEANAFMKAEQELLQFIKPSVARKTTREFEEILFSEFFSVTGGVLAGTLLAHALDKIALIPGILILLPGFFAMRGNISGTLAARLGAALHLGLLRHRGAQRFLKTNERASFALGVLASLFLGTVAYTGTWLFFGINAPRIILLAAVAGIISNLIMIPVTARLTLWLFKRGHDPDNVMGPYITMIGDIVSIISVLLAVVVV
jgi:mgtE-like transporter